MNAVQHIIEIVLSALVRQPEVNTTVVYPTRGKAVVLHDDLGISAERSWYETPEALQEEATFCTPNVRISAHRDRPFRYTVTDHFANNVTDFPPVPKQPVTPLPKWPVTLLAKYPPLRCA